MTFVARRDYDLIYGGSLMMKEERGQQSKEKQANLKGIPFQSATDVKLSFFTLWRYIRTAPPPRKGMLLLSSDAPWILKPAALTARVKADS
jgi:hypothetical protein